MRTLYIVGNGFDLHFKLKTKTEHFIEHLKEQSIYNEISNAFVENVVTHGYYRKKGYATACLNFAKQITEENNCYKMMLLTGSKEESILNFYRNAGYNSSDKTAFIQWIDM